MNESKLNPISKDDLQTLSNSELCERMHAVLYTILCESYTDQRAIDSFPSQNIKDFFKSKKIQSLSNEHQRVALRKCYEYLVQDEYLSRISGWINGAIYNENYNENTCWLSPRFQSINCASDHFKITGSAVALERMTDLLHIIETGNPIPHKKNKIQNLQRVVFTTTK